MGNRQASQKTKDAKSKEEKKREKEIRKDEKRRKKKEKERKKKIWGDATGCRGSAIGSDWEESSQVTESESSVFHSAENVSASPYLDSCTRSDLEQLPPDVCIPRWGPASSVSAYQLHYQHFHQPRLDQHQPPQQQHPMVLSSSKDFKDGFSLEACIPPEIARRDTRDLLPGDSGTLVRDAGGTCEGSVKSKRSNASESNKSKASSKSSQFASPLPYHMSLTSHPGGDDTASMTSSQTSAGGGAGGYSTPLLSTPIFGRMERPHSPISPREASPHHPHFFNHQRNLVAQNTLLGESPEHTQIQQLHHHNQKPQQICPIYQDISPLLIQQHQHQQQYHQQQIHQQQIQQQQMHQQIHQQQKHHQHQQIHQHPQRPNNIVDEDTLIRKQQIQNSQHQIQAFQHHPGILDYRNLPKPASPHPTRRAFSPKMTSPPFKLISSDESSSSPTTPVPQRRATGAATLLNIFRSGSKKEKIKKENKKCPEKQGGSGGECADRKGESGETKVKQKWKTWERSSSKKADRTSKSIFGTVRKSERTKSSSSNERYSDVIPADYRVNDQKFEEFIKNKDDRVNNAGCRKMTLEELRRDSRSITERKSSPPMVKSPALCIMKLEELERNIENTIREKFPDAEPFLLKKRTKDEELKGSRSLPTTPSLKKKLYVNRDADGVMKSSRQVTEDDVTSSLNAVRSRLTAVGSALTTSQDARYESLPSPAMSPVVLRRFGARTRHASISPKIQRAKTAALYNSPLEMPRVEERQTPATRAVTKVPIYHAVSSQQPAPMISSQCLGAPLTQKSQSKYDNVNDSDEDVFQGTRGQRHHMNHHNQHQSHHLTRQQKVESFDSDEVEADLSYQRNDIHQPVIVPTFSAVFGSISPKLKRHLQEKFDEVNKDKQRWRKDSRGCHGEILCRGSKGSQESPVHSKATSPISPYKTPAHSLPDRQHSTSRSPAPSRHNDITDIRQLSKSPEQRRVASRMAGRNNSGEKISVKERVKSINRTLSESSGAPTGIPASPESDAKMTSLSASPVPARRDSAVSVDAQSPPLSPHQASRQVAPRKHSADHVVFGCAVALPCRRVAQPPPALSCEEVHEQRNPRTHAHQPLSQPSPLHNARQQRCKNAKNPGPWQAEDKPVVYHSSTPEFLSDTGDSNCSSDVIVTSEPHNVETVDPNISCLLQLSSGSVKVFHHQETGDSDSPHSENSQLGVTNVIHTPEQFEASLRQSRGDCLPNCDDLFAKYSAEDSKHQTEHLRKNTGQIFTNDNEDDKLGLQSSQEFLVRRQPLSQVICDLIHTGTQTGVDRSSGVESSNLDIQAGQDADRPVEQSDNMVKSTSHEQASITLAEKHLQSECSVSLPASPTLRRIERDLIGGNHEKPLSVSGTDVHPVHTSSGSPGKLTPFSSGSLGKASSDSENIMSRSTGSQTDSFTTAEKGVESIDLDSYSHRSESAESQGLQRQDSDREYNRTESSPDARFKETQISRLSDNECLVSNSRISEESSDEEIKFLKNVLAFKRTDIPQKQNEEQLVESVENETFVPPPSSPSAMNQLIEEFEEEDEEDDEIQERKEIEMAMQKESEIREFTDKIYKRLSDLLGSQSGEGEEVENEVFEVEPIRANVDMFEVDMTDTRDIHQESEGSSANELNKAGDVKEKIQGSLGQYGSRAIVISSKSPRSNRMKRVLTIKSSSSSITTTSSSSEDEEEANSIALRNMMLKKLSYEEEHLEMSRCSERVECDEMLEIQNLYLQEREGSMHQRCPSSSREYHSDDDVARGQGLPDYYDDKSLWRRNQKPPGQLSLDMAAARRSERRERWLKKRRRNRTDITGSQRTSNADSGSPGPRKPRWHQKFSQDSDDNDLQDLSVSRVSDDLSSEILSSPKYAKPILPFLSDIRSIRSNYPEEVLEDRMEAKVTSNQLYGAVPQPSCDLYNRDGYRHDSLKLQHRLDGLSSENEDFYDRDEDELVQGSGKGLHDVMSDPEVEIPGIEETFNELMSVQNILEEMTDRTTDGVRNSNSSNMNCLPLTKENLKSVRDYYKDKYSSGRHSRMSNTDRTESDLDIFSDPPDDASSDSNRYADDEDDDDILEPYTTADGDLAASGRPASPTEPTDDDLDDNPGPYVVGCTFYNSKAFPSVSIAAMEIPQCATSMVNVCNVSPAVAVSGTTGTSTPSILMAAPGSGANSDEEFWGGSAAGFEMSYRQLESAADAVSDTFHATREQMMDIQQHLQELRRQMEDLQDEEPE